MRTLVDGLFAGGAYLEAWSGLTGRLTRRKAGIGRFFNLLMRTIEVRADNPLTREQARALGLAEDAEFILERYAEYARGVAEGNPEAEPRFSRR